MGIGPPGGRPSPLRGNPPASRPPPRAAPRQGLRPSNPGRARPSPTRPGRHRVGAPPFPVLKLRGWRAGLLWGLRQLCCNWSMAGEAVGGGRYREAAVHTGVGRPSRPRSSRLPGRGGQLPNRRPSTGVSRWAGQLSRPGARPVSWDIPSFARARRGLVRTTYRERRDGRKPAPVLKLTRSFAPPTVSPAQSTVKNT